MSISGLAAGEVSLDSSGGLLAEFRASKAREAIEQVRQVELALAFCAFNSPDSIHPDSMMHRAATLPGSEGQLALAGAGAPGVAEFAVVEFGAVAGMSTDAARLYLGRCLEVAHRLPGVWAATRTGQVPAWRALRIADHTMALPVEGAAWVDDQVADLAGRVGPIVLKRLVEEAIIRFDPETAAHTALEALETRHATITLQQALSDLGPAGIATGHLDAILDTADALDLDTADALDLDTALTDLATDLATAGDTSPLEVRRAKALGLLARGHTPQISPAPTATSRRRRVVLHVHLAEAALHGAGDGIANLHSPTGHPLGQVSIEQVQDWCATPGTQITVKPVLDLATTITITSTGYQPSDRLRDQILALTPTGVFPYCHRPADSLDLDHILAHAEGGSTDTHNLIRGLGIRSACDTRSSRRDWPHRGFQARSVVPSVEGTEPYDCKSPRGSRPRAARHTNNRRIPERKRNGSPVHRAAQRQN